jgi:hypothetical protein
VNRLVPALLALLLAAPAFAASPRWGSLELGAQNYHPNIDREFVGSTPYDTVFGSGRGWLFTLGISRALFTGMGSLEVGLRTGYFQDSGKAVVTGTNPPERSGDTTRFHVIPTSLALTYRFDLLADRYNVPLAPYARATLERYNWWVSGAGTTENGATNGWSATGGIAFLLDFVDPGMAREMDQDTGINHTYLFAELTKTKINDFNSSSSWDLSDSKNASLAFGLLFVF